jgi:hypothetical protein
LKKNEKQEEWGLLSVFSFHLIKYSRFFSELKTNSISKFDKGIHRRRKSHIENVIL